MLVIFFNSRVCTLKKTSELICTVNQLVSMNYGKTSLKNFIYSVTFPFENTLFSSSHGSHITPCVLWQVYVSRTVLLAKFLTILQLFISFLIRDLWFLWHVFPDTVEPNSCFWPFKQYATYITFFVWHGLSLLILTF